MPNYLGQPALELKLRRDYLFIVLLAVAFVIKLCYGLYAFNLAEPESDELDYIFEAERVLLHGPLMLNSADVQTFVGPGFPWLLAFVKWIGGSIGAIIWINAFFSILIVVFIFKIGRLVLSTRWSFVAVVIALLYIPYTIYVGGVLKEVFLQFLVIWSIHLALNLKRDPKFFRLLLFSFSFAYLIHTDERYLFFLPVYFIFIINFDQGLIVSLGRIAKVFLAILLLCIPWFVRNLYFYDKPIFLTERLHAPVDARLGKQNNLVDLGQVRSVRLIEVRDSLLAGESPILRSGRERAIKEAFDNGLVPHNFSLTERFWFNTLGYWSPLRTSGMMVASGWKYARPRTALMNIAYLLNFGLLLPFLLLGLLTAWRQKLPIPMLLSLYLMCHYLLHVFLIFGSGRYRHPVDFIVILLAVFGIEKVFNFLKERFSHKSNIDKL